MDFVDGSGEGSSRFGECNEEGSKGLYDKSPTLEFIMGSHMGRSAKTCCEGQRNPLSVVPFLFYRVVISTSKKSVKCCLTFRYLAQPFKFLTSTPTCPLASVYLSTLTYYILHITYLGTYSVPALVFFNLP